MPVLKPMMNSRDFVLPMKLFILSLPALLLAAGVSAADLSTVISEASKYESGRNAEPLRQIERAVRESAGSAVQRAEVEAALVTLLAPSSTFEARRFACTQLAIIGTEASLPAIAELLKQPETVGIGCLAISSNPSLKANEVLRVALSGAAPAMRPQIIVTLGDRGDTGAVNALAELARGNDRSAAAAAISSLGKIADSAALKELAALRQGDSPDLARLASLASLVAGDKAAKRGDPAAATAIYQELQAPAQFAYARRAAFEGLLRLDADGGEQRVMDVLRGSDATLKPSAITHVRALKSTGASAKFAKEMAALSPAERVQMIESLAARNDAAARAAITEQLLAEDAAVRRAAAMTFAAIGDASSAPALAQVLAAAKNAPEQQVLEMVMASLKGGAAVDAQIIALLQAGSAPKAALINVLARRGSPTAIPVLLEQAGSPDAAVAKAAFRALSKLAAADHLSALLDKMLELKAGAARGEAENAIAKAIDRTSDVGRRSSAVIGALGRARDTETRCALISLLPACGGPQALAAVASARADQDAQVREAAFRALAGWGDSAAIDPLLEIAQSSAPNTERVVALRGSVRLLGTATEYSTREVAARFQKAFAVAKTLNEGKLVLAGLASVHDPMALGLIEPFLSDADVQAEAAVAAVSLAPYLCGSAREATLAMLRKVADLPVDQKVKQSALNLREVIGKFDDFVMAWQVAGPFEREGKDGQALFEVAFGPEQAGTPNVKWKVMPAGALKARPWQLDLGTLYGGNNRAAYARTWIYSETQQPARLEFGSDDGLKVWLNGEVVLAANRGGDVVPGAEKAAVTLKPGWNTLLLKVTQWTSGWGFCARVAKPDGSPLQGVRAEVNPAK